jgi:phytoene dehydrogenase-like protein
MKPSGNKQEVIILGSGLGGLIAGTLLAKNDRPVLLLKEKGYQPSYFIKGYHFVPFSNFSEKRVRPSLLKKISQELDLPSLMDPQEGVRPSKIVLGKSKQKETFQVVLPKSRIDIFSQRSLFQEEWKREFPSEVTQIEEFFNELDRTHHLLQEIQAEKNGSPFFGVQQGSLFKKFFTFDPFPKGKIDPRLSSFSKEFREFIKLQLISWGNLYSNQFPISLASRILLDEMNESNLNVDLENLEKEILNKFLNWGGKIEEIDRVKKIELSWKKEQTLLLDRDPSVFQSQCLILNAPLHRISSLMGKKGKGLLKWEKRIRPLYVRIPLFLGIREKVIPVGMKDLLISILDIEKPYEDGNVLFLSLSPKGDETRAPDGCRALTVESLMDVEKWEQTLLVDYQHGVMKHLNHLFPFLESHTEFADFQWASEHVPKWSYSHFLYESISDFDWREGRVPVKLSKNIYFVGKENFPYLGLEGEAYSGFIVAQQILRKYS